MKKFLSLALVLVLTLGLPTTVAASQPRQGGGWCWGFEAQEDYWGRGWCGGFRFADGNWGCPFRDIAGNFLFRGEVVANLDALVADGTITQAQRDAWLESFDQGFGMGFGFCGGGRFGGRQNGHFGGRCRRR